MSDDFKDKIKTIGVMSRTGQGNQVTEDFIDGHKVKHTREGDPDLGYVTHTEHADSDRVDALIQPVTIHAGVHVHKGEAAQ